jgi:hypothetical protein
MGSNPLDTFLLRRISEAEERRPAPRARPDANPVTGPSAAAPGNPVPAPPKLR